MMISRTSMAIMINHGGAQISSNVRAAAKLSPGFRLFPRLIMKDILVDLETTEDYKDGV